MKKSTFYLLSFTWGLPMTLVGCIVALCLLITGHKAKRWGYSWYFEVGENWGGVELGAFFLTDKTTSTHTKNHEFGHGIQNCYFGFLMPFIVCIPSAIRYWYREIMERAKPHKALPPYDSVWFEGQATRLGNYYIEVITNVDFNTP